MRVIKQLVMLFGVMAFLPAHALDPQSSFFQYASGSPNLEVSLPTELLDVEQDSQGFLWLASQRGLIKFDGLETTLYRVSQYPALQSNQITKLFVSSADQLFIATEGGLSVFDGVDFRALGEGRSWARRVRAFAEQDDGSIWVGSEEGLWRLSGTGDELERVTDLGDRSVYSLLWHDGALMVGARGQLTIFASDNVRTVDLPPTLGDVVVQDLVVYQGQLWGASDAGLFYLDDRGVWPAPQEALQGRKLSVLLADKDGSLWFAGDETVGRFLPDGQMELPDLTSTFGFTPDLTAFIEDSAGRQWDTSLSYGLNVSFDSTTKRFSYTEGVASVNVTAVAVDPNATVYLATDVGVSVVRESAVENIIDEDFASGREVRSITVHNDGTLWLGGESGLHIFEQIDGRWEPRPPPVGFERKVNTMLSDGGVVWIGTQAGLFRHQQGTTELVAGTESLEVRSLFVHSSGELWIGAKDQLVSLVNRRLSVHAADKTQRLGAIVAIQELPDGRMVAATPDQGILVGQGARWSVFDEDQGLPPEQLFSIEYHDQALWLMTSGGVFRLPSAHLFESTAMDRLDVAPVYTNPDYRATQIVNCCRGENHHNSHLIAGSLVVSTDDGVVFFDIARIEPPHIPRPYIKSVSAGARTIGDYRDGVLLRRRETQLKVDYSALHLVDGEMVRFRYRLNGQDDGWINVGKSRSVNLSNFATGVSKFELQASPSQGLWVGPIVGFEFQRPASFFESGLFKALLWVAAVGFALSIIWVRLLVTRQRHRLLEHKIDTRTRALKDINQELESANVALHRATQTDPLTGLVNRRFFDSANHQAQVDELAAHGLLAIIDIDHFKRVNDTHGHTVGDDILCQFANVLTSITRQSDLVARWGGEEFLLVCQCPDGDATFMLKRIREAVNDHRFKTRNGQRIKIECSTGAVRYPLRPNETVGDTLPVLFELADAALYTVKLSGRDGWAMVESNGGQLPKLTPRRTSRLFAELIRDKHLTFVSSRPEINAAASEKITRLRTGR